MPVCFLIFMSAQLAYGIGGPQFAPTKPVVENISECAASVRNSVSLARSTSTWGPFALECALGKATRMSVPKNSPIFKNWPTFVRAHPALFSVDSNHVIENDGIWEGHKTLSQTWKGLHVGADSIGEVLRWGDEPDVIMGINSVDTSNWGPEPSISSAAAAGIVSALWKKEHRPLKHTLTSGLSLFSGEEDCGSSKAPRIAWRIYVQAREGEPAQICRVDVTGQICGTCDSNR